MTPREICSAWILVMFVMLFQGSKGIKISAVNVPPFVEVGSGGELDCKWQEDNDHMYSIKWYQQAHEFYRYTPTAKSQVQIFDLPTLDVDGQKSWGGSVWIANVTLAADGAFHCEVSAEGPTFHTASQKAILNVVDLPDGGPMINGIRTQYMAGEWVEINCRTHRARPAPNLSFTINNKPVVDGWIEPQVNLTDNDEGLMTSSIRMRFTLMPRLLQEGYATVQCAAVIPGIYNKTVQSHISTRAPYHASVHDGGATEGFRPRICTTWGVVVVTLLIASLYHQVF